MKNSGIKGFISILLCFVMIIGLSAPLRVSAEDDKKIAELSAEYIGAKNENGDVLVGTVLSKTDFKFTMRYDGEEKFVPLPESELSHIKLSLNAVPIDAKSAFELAITYDNTAKTKTGEELVYKITIPKTNETFDKMEATWNGASKYHVGDAIKKGEITLSVVYGVITPNGRTQTTRTISHNQFTISPEAIVADGNNNITVEFNGRKTNVQVKGYGEKELEVIYSGDKNPVVGQIVDTKKIKASIVYTNNDKKAVKTSDLSFDNLEVKAPGENTVTVTYGNLKGKFVVNGVAKTAEKMSAKYTGTDLVVGSKIDLSKITLELTNNDKTKETITAGFTISPDTVKEVGANTITVSYKGFNDTVVIKGTEVLPTNITATYNGGTVIEGSKISKSGILVTAYYPDGTNKTVSDFDISTETMNTVGMQEVIVTYKKLTATIYVPVTAKTVTQLEAVYNGGALEQYESLDRKKLVVTATYNDGSSSNVEDYTIMSTTASKVGDNVFTVNFGAKTATFTVEAFARRIAGVGTLESTVGGGDYSSTLTAFIQDQFVREDIKLETEDLEDDLIKSAIKRVNNTKKFIAFEMDIDSFQFDENQYLTAELTIPDEFDPARVAVYFTPDRKKIMVQQTGGLVANNLYRFYAYSSGTYVIMENDNNDVTKQELRDTEQRKPFMVVSIDKSLTVGTKSKIKPYVLFSKDKDEEFTYEVDNEDLMTISKLGEMTAKATGTVSVTVSAKKGGYSETYDIKISPKEKKRKKAN